MRGTLQTLLPTLPGGVREDLNPAMLPEGTLLSSSNWLVRRGVGRPRPGYRLQMSADDSARVIGIGIRGTKNQSDDILIATLTHIYSWDGNSITDVTGSGVNTSTPGQPMRIVTFSQGGSDYAMLLNNANALREWTGSGNTTATAGSPPTGLDMTVAGNRIVIVHPTDLPHRVRWSGFKDRTSWPALNITDLTDTPGHVIAARAFGPNTFGVYKDDAVYVATLQAAVEPFQFQFIARVPGPISPAALVDALGIHYWIGEDYAIYKFDGSAPKLVTTGLSRTIAQNMSLVNRDQMFGFPWFSQDERELWFFYPTITSTFNAVSLNLQTDAVNHHVFDNIITAAMDWRMQATVTIDDLDDYSTTIDGLDAYSSSIDDLTGGTTRIALIGDSVGGVHAFGSAVEDNGEKIAWSFEHPWVAPGKLEARNYLDAVIPYWKDTEDENITVRVALAVTDRVNDSETETITELDTATNAQHLLTFPNQSGKLVKVRQFGSRSSTMLEYRGTLVTSWNKGRV